MKKILTYLIFASLIISMASCHSESDLLQPEGMIADTHHVSIESARADLLSLLKDVDGDGTRGSGKRQISEAFTLTKKGTRAEENDSARMYVFNFEDEQGYAIMAADDRLPSLLAYAEYGTLKQNEENVVPGGVGLFFTGLDPDPTDPVFNIGIIEDGTLSRSYGAWENTVYSGAECKVKWGQGNPYNIHCPLIDGHYPYTGCVATACAQLMAVYKYPPVYNGMYFNWDEMTKYPYANNVSGTGRDHIAWLMQRLGVKSNLDMDYGYGENGSTSTSANIPRTLKAFGYSNGGNFKTFNSSEITQELLNGYPAIVRGDSFRERHEFLGMKIYYTYSGGHSWLAHGLLERKRNIYYTDSNNKVVKTETEKRYYVRYNWGWDSLHDGYYLVDTFDACNNPDLPDSTRGEIDGTVKDYKFEVKMVTGIRK